ncbi:MAG: response regulator [Candidatus Latescibacteria bacterium]|nr:response regulator [Candidatus Latescibacterota bacterium]
MSEATERRLLIVDDTPQNLQVLGGILREQGYKLSVAQSGAQALEVARRVLPELILLDVMMPEMDGFEVCQHLKADPATAEIPVIFLTAKTEAEDVVRGFELGAVDYVTKPFNPPELLKRVQTHLELALLRRDLERQVAEKTGQLRREHEERLQAEHKLAQARRLEGLGRLAFGVAHEINTPLQAVASNLQFLGETLPELQRGLEQYTRLHALVRAGQVDVAQLKAIEEELAANGFDYLAGEWPKALAKGRSGVERVGHIVRAMQELVHSSDAQKVPTDLNQLVASTAEELHPRWQPVAELKLDLEPDLPLVPCLPGDMRQVLVHLMANAVDAVQAADRGRGRLLLSTRSQANEVVLRLGDTGAGIPARARDRIFDPFFTTKEVGAGMGMGLAVVYEVVVNRLGGAIAFESEVGRGTVFAVHLPR